jgi:nucleoside-diphosphate-sugar epimerase
MILITTAGKVGSAAARLIAQRDVPVRALVRHPEKVAPLAQAGVEIFPGDLDSPDPARRRPGCRHEHGRGTKREPASRKAT